MKFMVASPNSRFDRPWAALCAEIGGEQAVRRVTLFGYRFWLVLSEMDSGGFGFSFLGLRTSLLDFF
jgi:hypothetical protein